MQKTKLMGINNIQISMRNLKLLVAIFCIVFTTLTVQIPLFPGGRACSAIMSSFDPIKIDIRLPSFADKLQDESFKISITQRLNGQTQYQSFVAPGTIFRKMLEIKNNIIYQVCITLESTRSFPENTVLYIPFSQTQDFQSLINHIEIPPELAKQDTLKAIYGTASKLEGVGRVIASHQQRERALEDQIVAKNIHKTQRIMTLGLIQCLVIILSGVYQICALRKFLIEKNLY